MRYNFIAMSALSQALSQAASALIRAIRMVGKSAADEPKPEEIQSFRQRAEAGDVNAQRALGGAYLNGMGVPQNYEEAAKWIRPAAEREDDIAQCLLGIMHYRGNGVRQDHAEAINLFHRAAMRGNIIAQFCMGALHSLGRGVPQNYREAYVWHSIATANGFGVTAPTKDLSPESMKAEAQRDALADWLPPADLSAAQAEATRLHAEIRKNLERSGATD